MNRDDRNNYLSAEEVEALLVSIPCRAEVEAAMARARVLVDHYLSDRVVPFDHPEMELKTHPYLTSAELAEQAGYLVYDDINLEDYADFWSCPRRYWTTVTPPRGLRWIDGNVYYVSFQ